MKPEQLRIIKRVAREQAEARGCDCTPKVTIKLGRAGNTAILKHEPGCGVDR